MSVNKPFRIVMHWSAGTNKVSALDKEHYHFITDGAGNMVAGNRKPEANNNTSDGDYSAHTRNLNTGAVGMAVAAMAGAVERPFNAGKYPITEKQINAFVKHVADIADTYGIPITRETILTHGEVQATLGIAQSGKWDINWLPGMEGAVNPVLAGDMLRERIADQMPLAGQPAPTAGKNVGIAALIAAAIAMVVGFWDKIF